MKYFNEQYKRAAYRKYESVGSVIVNMNGDVVRDDGSVWVPAWVRVEDADVTDADR